MSCDPNSPDLINLLDYLDYQVWGNAGVFSQTATEARLPETVPEFTDALQFIWSALPENLIDNTWKTTASDCRRVCHPALDIFNT